MAAGLKRSYCLKGAEIQQKAPGPSSPRWRFAHLENRQRRVGGDPGNHHPGNSQTYPDQVLNPGSAGRWQGTVSSLFRDFQTPATPGREMLSEHCTRPRPQTPGFRCFHSVVEQRRGLQGGAREAQGQESRPPTSVPPRTPALIFTALRLCMGCHLTRDCY